MGTKLRALYQRNKGRDLFDLWLVLTRLKPDERKITAAFHHYMGDDAFTFPKLSLNLSQKLDDRDFMADPVQLIQQLPDDYSPVGAANLVMERLGPDLRHAPAASEIVDGRWRR